VKEEHFELRVKLTRGEGKKRRQISQSDEIDVVKACEDVQVE